MGRPLYGTDAYQLLIDPDAYAFMQNVRGPDGSYLATEMAFAARKEALIEETAKQFDQAGGGIEAAKEALSKIRGVKPQEISEDSADRLVNNFDLSGDPRAAVEIEFEAHSKTQIDEIAEQFGQAGGNRQAAKAALARIKGVDPQDISEDSAEELTDTYDFSSNPRNAVEIAFDNHKGALIGNIARQFDQEGGDFKAARAAIRRIQAVKPDVLFYEPPEMPAYIAERSGDPLLVEPFRRPEDTQVRGIAQPDNGIDASAAIAQRLDQVPTRVRPGPAARLDRSRDNRARGGRAD